MSKQPEKRVHAYRLGTQGKIAACGRRLTFEPPWPTYEWKLVTCRNCRKAKAKGQGIES